MASNFLGSTIKATLQDGRVLQGLLQEISPEQGQLVLEDVTLITPAGRSAHLSAFPVSRESVKSLEMLSQKAEAATSSDQSTRRKAKKAALAHGSEADDSAVTLDEGSSRQSSSRRKGNPHIRRKSSNVTVTPSKSDLSKDFDFAQGLATFDKKAVFQQIREQDQTDPSLRLVAHNRKNDKYTTKLSIHENVLDEAEQIEALEAIRPKLPLLPHTLLADASTTEDEAETEDDLANGVESLLTRPLLAASSDLPCPVLSWKEWKDVLQLANIELGPNLIQRIENGARGIATYILRHLLKGYTRSLNIVVLCGQGTKGQCGLRTGAHLINKGANVTAVLIAGETLWVQRCQRILLTRLLCRPSSLEFQLRLFSAAGGRLVRSTAGKPCCRNSSVPAEL